MEKGIKVCFLDEWEEKDRFNYGTYIVTSVRNQGRTINVKEVVSGIVYSDVPRKELLILN